MSCGVLRDPCPAWRWGDAAVVVDGRELLACVRLAPGAVFRCRHGAFPHDRWVGTQPGTRSTPAPAAGSGGRGGGVPSGGVHLLPLTPELWTRTLRHRTQILYAPDCAAIVAGLGLRPGRVVAETGTGSGSLTTHLARAVAPSGRVLTFEFHAPRAAAARADVAANGLSSVVSVFVRDTEATGFPPGLARRCDAVFLDLPGPHNAAAAAAAALRPGGALCSFSPCVEQAGRLCEAAAAAGLVDMRTVEVLDREMEWRRQALLQPPARRGVPAAAAASAAAAAAGADGDADAAAAAAAEEEGRGAKRPRPGGGAGAAGTQPLPQLQPKHPLLVWPCAEARGHTGFLTFARKPVEEAAAAAAAGAAVEPAAVAAVATTRA